MKLFGWKSLAKEEELTGLWIGRGNEWWPDTHLIWSVLLTSKSLLTSQDILLHKKKLE